MNTKYLEIIKAPVITEKSSALAQEGKYVFKVDSKANKTEIKEAIEKIFKVKVESIATINAKVKKTFDTGKLKAVFDITLEDEFVIHEVKLIEGQKGRFVSMPSEKWSGEQGRVRRVDIAHPLNAKARAALFAAIEDAYENHLKNISENENTIKTN